MPSTISSVHRMANIKDKVYSRKFKKSWYSDSDWLYGSYYLNKLFCLPCIIISSKSSVSCKYGFNDFGNMTRALRKHECSALRILGFSKLKKNLTTIEDALLVNQFNENVQLIRRFMELPIRVVPYLGKQELAFRGHDEGMLSYNRGNFNELLEVFISISPVDIQQHYKNIASGDDSTDIGQKSQCSIIVRYVNNGGKLVERFLGFYDFQAAWKSLETKPIGQCFDGASVISGHLNGLQAKIKEQAPQALFVHCLAHRLNLVLQQSCNSISNCRIFCTYQWAVSRATVSSEQRDGRTRTMLTRDQLVKKYRALYYEILDTISLQIKTCFEDLEKLLFVALMDTFRFQIYSENIPTQALNNLKEMYPSIFTEFQRLKNELQLIYSDDQYHNIWNHTD
nr:unnamed protein product [Callosobruchus analis]